MFSSTLLQIKITNVSKVHSAIYLVLAIDSVKNTVVNTETWLRHAVSMQQTSKQIFYFHLSIRHSALVS
jgi:hypothetical protein